MPEGALSRRLTGHIGEVRGIALSPDGQVLASGGYGSENNLRLWRVSDGALLRAFTANRYGVRCIACSPDGQTLVSGGYASDSNLKIWRVSDGTLLRTLVASEENVLSLAFSPDGQLLANGNLSRTIEIWRVADGVHERTVTTPYATGWAVAFSPDGRMLAAAGLGDKSIRVWRVEDGALVRTLTGHTDYLTCVSFSADGMILASGGGRHDDTIKLWRVSDWSLQRTLTAHRLGVISVSFSPDGQLLVSSGTDGTLKLWRVADGALLETYDQETGTAVNAAAFSSDGRFIAYGRDDATVVVARTPRLPLRDAKFGADGATVLVEDLVVSAVFDGFFYAQDLMRTGGIRVVSPIAVDLGASLRLAGKLATTADGERCVEATQVQVAGSGTVRPLVISGRSVGGESSGWTAGGSAGQQGVTGSFGLNNIGLLVSTAGKVTALDPSSDPSWFTLWDSSGFTILDDSQPKFVPPADPDSHPGVRVWAPGLALPAVGSFVTVTGISSCYRAGEELYPLVRVRGQQDIALAQNQQ